MQANTHPDYTVHVPTSFATVRVHEGTREPKFAVYVNTSIVARYDIQDQAVSVAKRIVSYLELKTGLVKEIGEVILDF